MISSEWEQLLGSLTQPVFLVQGGLICYANPAAASISATEGLSVYAVLGGAGEEYHAFTGEGSLSLPLDLAAGSFRALVRRVGNYDLFALSAEAGSPLSERLSAFSDVAQSLRLPVANLFATASNLFPRLEELEDERVRTQMAVLNKSFYQLLRTIGNLSDAAGLMAGKIVMRMEPLELCGWFRDLTGRLAPLCEAAGVSFTAECPARTQLGQIDPIRLRRAVLNLFSNALKRTIAASGGSIHVSFELNERSAAVRIADSGGGMDANTLSEAFSHFAGAPDLDPLGGVGLGLPIARWIAAQHGGTVVIQSLPGKGTTAVLSFDYTRGSSTALRSPSISPSGFDPVLVELSDALPAEIYDSENVN